MTENDNRKTKGLQIAQTKELTRTPKGWFVPSQTTNGGYLVYQENGKTACTCPDYETRGCVCKHQYAVMFTVEKKTDEEGNTTITKTMKVTYPQAWASYNAAQTSEIILFDKLLADLCAGIVESPQITGRPRLGMRNSVYCAVEKVYSQLSSRRAYSLYMKAQDRMDINRTPNFNAINKLLQREDITPILNRLLVLSAMPLQGVETTFAQDSTGFSTNSFSQYAVEKYGEKRKHKWVKAHALIGVKTNVIVGAEITSNNSNDSPFFKPLVMEAHNNGFNIQEVLADKGYASMANHEIANDIGAVPFIPFKHNTVMHEYSTATWTKMYHYFMFKRDEFMAHYHKRSNVEATFKAVKMKFGDKLKAKTFTAQRNELLCKFIAHNIVCVIHEMKELGIVPNFMAAPKEGVLSGV